MSTVDQGGTISTSSRRRGDKPRKKLESSPPLEANTSASDRISDSEHVPVVIPTRPRKARAPGIRKTCVLQEDLSVRASVTLPLKPDADGDNPDETNKPIHTKRRSKTEDIIAAPEDDHHPQRHAAVPTSDQESEVELFTDEPLSHPPAHPQPLPDDEDEEVPDEQPRHDRVAEDSAHVAEDSAHVAEDPDRVAEDPDRVAEDPDRVAEDPDRVAENPDRVAEDSDRVAEETDRGAEDAVAEEGGSHVVLPTRTRKILKQNGATKSSVTHRVAMFETLASTVADPPSTLRKPKAEVIHDVGQESRVRMAEEPPLEKRISGEMKIQRRAQEAPAAAGSRVKHSKRASIDGTIVERKKRSQTLAGVPAICPGFEEEGQKSELLAALRFRRLKTVHAEKSWAGVGNKETEEEQPVHSCGMVFYGGPGEEFSGSSTSSEQE